jgi:hypothetical protein
VTVTFEPITEKNYREVTVTCCAELYIFVVKLNAVLMCGERDNHPSLVIAHMGNAVACESCILFAESFYRYAEKEI